jgi:VHL beta domain
VSKPYLLALALALPTSACLEGDPNPYAEQSGGGGSATAAAPTAISPGNSCSQSTTAQVSLSLNNLSAYNLRVFWVDYGCQDVDYGSLAPGQTFTTSTLATHPWRLREATSNALVFEYVTGTSPTQSVDVRVR